MQEKELKKYAKKILNLELLCQQGIDVSKNLKKMKNIFNNFTIDDLFRINEIMEEDT